MSNNSLSDMILSPLKKVARIVTIIAFIVAASCSLLIFMGSFPGDFFGVIGYLFEMVFFVGLLAIIPVLLLINKDGLAKKFMILLLAFWFVRTLLSYFGDFSNVSGLPALAVVAYVFEFLIALALLAAFVLSVIDEFSEGKEKKFQKLSALLFVISLALFVFVLLFMIIFYAVNGAPWTMYFDLLESLAIFAGVTFGYLYFVDLKLNAPEKEEKAAENNEKAEATKETAEEAETAEETEVAEETETAEEAPAEEPEAAEETAEETEEAPAEQAN